MRPELEHLRLIEQQLLPGRAALPPEDWNLRLLLDGELAADTEKQRLMYQGLRLAGRRQLRQELRTIHARLYGGWLGRLRALWPM
ncbi:hypothetical protein MUN81_00830 [Hymenobacter sp. 5317J-9]|uniref:hypothetical protein n=1 Tax=Hymenobacter sp. 5317J-9 TaxID=2932250 RepID=UPI001FD716F4|nr:hypothetical protein [Hymenobacter sp. 5317J-9]UOQ98051.1 hypothetical protein MUN81_00830 [Hymenobacter sp. 5317J-9]